MTSFTTSVMRRLSIYEQAFIGGIAAPLTFLIFTQRTLRGFERGETYVWTHAVDLYKSDLFLTLSFITFGLALLTIPKLRSACLIFLQLLAIPFLVIEVITHQFFMRTGSTLDFNLIIVAITNFKEIWWILRSETSISALVMMFILCLWITFSPWVIIRRSTTCKPSSEPTYNKNKPALNFLIAAVLLLGAVMPPLAEPHIAFSRSSMINIVWTSTYPEYESTGIDTQRSSLSNIKLKKRPMEKRKKNVAIIVLESTRVSSTSVYNTTINTTPYLAEIASKGTVAERAYSVVPHTSKALVSIFCGIEPDLYMQVSESNPNGIPTRCIAELLAEQGYNTVFFQSAIGRFEGRPQQVANMGFEYFIPVDDMPDNGYQRANYFGYEDDIMLEPSRLWLSKNSDKPFLTTYLTIIPHHDYQLPPGYKEVYFTSHDTYNRYLNAVNYLDSFVKKLSEQYKSLGIYEDTVFVFVGDHGEGFGEHGRFQHDNVIYEEGIQVPLIFYDPAKPHHNKVKNLASQIDILPTLTDMLGFDIINGSLPGFAITDIPDNRQLFAKCYYQRRCIASISKKLKYIHHFYDRPDEIFDLTVDPLEKNNIAETNMIYIDDAYQQVADWDATVTGMYHRHLEFVQKAN